MSENQPQPVNPATANATQPPVSPLPPATPASEPAKTDADPKLWEPTKKRLYRGTTEGRGRIWRDLPQLLPPLCHGTVAL